MKYFQNLRKWDSHQPGYLIDLEKNYISKDNEEFFAVAYDSKSEQKIGSIFLSKNSNKAAKLYDKILKKPRIKDFKRG